MADYLDKFLNHLNKHYRVVWDEELFPLLFKFNVEQLEGIAFMKSNGWKEEITQGGQIRYWSPTVKDRNSILTSTDFKKLNTSDEHIDLEREKTKHKFLRDKEN